MKQIWPNYSYSPTTNVLTLTGLNIDRDQLLLVSAPERGRIMYNFADSTVTASAFTAGANTGLTLVASTAGLTTTAALVIYYDDQVSGISGTVTANLNLPSFAGGDGDNLTSAVQIGYYDNYHGEFRAVNSLTSQLPVTVSSLPAISGTVTANASLTDFPKDNGVPYIPIAFVDSPGGSFTQVSKDPNCGLPISGTVTANTFALQGTAVTTSNFTSTTASTVLANYNATREVLTIFSEGPGTLFVSAGATCTTIAYQVRLSAGDYYEVPNHQTTITHSAVFATAGTARIVQIS